MAQLDKLLAQIALRGARGLVLEPGKPPLLELAGSGTAPLLPNALPSPVLEVLAQEVLPAYLVEGWQKSGQAQFQHEANGTLFRIRLSRGHDGLALRAEPEAGDGLALPAPPTPLRSVPSEPKPAPIQPVPDANGSLDFAKGLFRALLAQHGSDLHLTSYEMPLIRIHGELEDMPDFGLLGPSKILEVMEALAPTAAWERFQAHHDADFAYGFEEGGCRLRVNYFQDRSGPGLVCRVIPNEIPDPDQLGLSEPIQRLAQLPKGLVLVTGPTGSGKSTTLAAIIDLANRARTDHILTIEDPIEFVHPRKKCLVNQREVGTHTESFKSGLRAALREDPDIVLVGEMRDLETIAIALETAITGHLVFGTLHTSSAIGTIDRIVDQFPADRQQQIRVMLADSLKAVLSQILLKKVGGGGRVAAIESLFITPAIANLIREGKNFQIPSAMQTGRAYGQKLLNDSLIELILSGQIAPLDAYMKCPDRETFIQACKRSGIPFDLRETEAGPD